MSPGGFECGRCDEWHPELPFAYHAPAPDQWSPAFAQDQASELGADQCVIRDEHFFVRGLVRIPVVDADVDFEWGAWVSLSPENFDRMSDLWHTVGRESEPPYFGWLCTSLGTYPESTLGLRSEVITQPVGLRPLIRLEPTDHPLAVEQRQGITTERVKEIAALVLRHSEL